MLAQPELARIWSVVSRLRLRDRRLQGGSRQAWRLVSFAVRTMWCGNCRKNVRCTIAPGGDCIACALCGQALPGGLDTGKRSPETQTPDEQAAPAASEDVRLNPPAAGSEVSVALDAHKLSLDSALESWELDEDLRHIERRLQALAATLGDVSRLEQSHAEPSRPPNFAKPQGAVARTSSISLANGLQMAGIMVLACGLALLLWSWLTPRPDLLAPAIAATLLGQLAVVAGLCRNRETQGASTKGEPVILIADPTLRSTPATGELPGGMPRRAISTDT